MILISVAVGLNHSALILSINGDYIACLAYTQNDFLKSQVFLKVNFNPYLHIDWPLSSKEVCNTAYCPRDVRSQEEF